MISIMSLMMMMIPRRELKRAEITAVAVLKRYQKHPMSSYGKGGAPISPNPVRSKVYITSLPTYRAYLVLSSLSFLPIPSKNIQ
jgi:hypothetical protein